MRWNKHLRLLHQVGVFIYWYMMHGTIKLKRNMYFNRFTLMEEPSNQNILSSGSCHIPHPVYSILSFSTNTCSYIGRCTNLQERERKAASAPKRPPAATKLNNLRGNSSGIWRKVLTRIWMGVVDGWSVSERRQTWLCKAVLRRLQAALHHDLCTQFLEQQLQSVKNGGNIGSYWRLPRSDSLLTALRNSQVKKLWRASYRISFTTKTIYFYEMQSHKRGSGDCVIMAEPLPLVFGQRT